MESTYEGLPCRHEFCIFIKETKDISCLNIQERWKFEYFKKEELDAISDSENESQEEENELKDENINDEVNFKSTDTDDKTEESITKKNIMKIEERKEEMVICTTKEVRILNFIYNKFIDEKSIKKKRKRKTKNQQ